MMAESTQSRTSVLIVFALGVHETYVCRVVLGASHPTGAMMQEYVTRKLVIAVRRQ